MYSHIDITTFFLHLFMEDYNLLVPIHCTYTKNNSVVSVNNLYYIYIVITYY